MNSKGEIIHKSFLHPNVPTGNLNVPKIANTTDREV